MKNYIVPSRSGWIQHTPTIERVPLRRRCRHILTAALLLGAVLPRLLPADTDPPLDRPIEVGDEVSPEPGALLRNRGQTLAKVDGSETLVVQGVFGRWVMVTVDQGNERLRGCIDADELRVVRRRPPDSAPYRDSDGNVYYCVRLSNLELLPAEGQPAPDMAAVQVKDSDPAALYPQVLLDAPGEAYIAFESAEWYPGDGDSVDDLGRLVARIPHDHQLTGWISLPKPDRSGTFRVRFRAPADAADRVGSGMFLWGKLSYYRWMAAQPIPGNAWFRYQADLLRREQDRRAGRPAAPSSAVAAVELTRTFGFFSGGRALAENLQLDQDIMPTGDDQKQVPISGIPGITVPEFNWNRLINGAAPPLDPLARWVPHDQHVAFFPSLQAMLALAEEATIHDTPLLHIAAARSENAHAVERYQRQLGVRMADLQELADNQHIRSAALTGSDPSFWLGTDVTLLLESPEPEIVYEEIWAILDHSTWHEIDAVHETRSVDGFAIRAVRTEDRRLSSYLVRMDGAVMLTNSPHQVRRILDIHRQRHPSLASLKEYHFFRKRYARGAPAETVFVFLSDAAIRRWCSATWKIGESRRLRAAAALAHLQAEHANELATGTVEPRTLDGPHWGMDLGTVTLSASGVHSSIYGSLDFMTPVAELDLQQVAVAEASAYNRWRRAYERSWQAFFDPIALRAAVTPRGLVADLSVMPLTASTTYRMLIDLCGKAALDAGAGDRHRTLLHGIAAFDKAADLFLGLELWYFSHIGPFQPRDWLGNTAELYVDPDPQLHELAALAALSGAEREAALAERSPGEEWRLPIAARLAVTDAAKARQFLDAMQKHMQEKKKTTFEPHSYRGREYTRIVPAKDDKAAIPLTVYSFLADDALTLTLCEDLVKRAIDRAIDDAEDLEPAESGSPLPPMPWLGTHLSLQVDQAMLEVANFLARETYQQAMQQRAWSNLPALNQWRRHFPGEDPAALHHRVWGVELVCPGGGRYVWNDAWQTVESSVYGHPGEPKAGPPAPAVLSTFSTARFGLEFEPNGLRARVMLYREPPQ